MTFAKWFVLWGFTAMLVACSNSTSVSETEMTGDSCSSVIDDADETSSGSHKEMSSSSREKEEISSSSDKDKTISGVAQKGPFLAQSVVKIYELKKKTLAKTGNVFSGEVGSDGRFEVKKVELSSPYALLEVNGRYRNELTGDVSSNEITLRALVDLENREEVNINLLTHLTYERILYLVGTGVDFATAKKQAESEFLSAFHIDDKFKNFENMNIVGDGDESAALLAISVLVLSYYSDAKLAEFLESFAADFKKDGTWDDETTRYNVRIRFEFMSDDVERIYNNIVDWKIGSVPKFGKYIRKIKCRSNGLSNCYEECGVEGTIRKEDYSWSLCLGGVWFGADARIVDTFGWGAGEDGELRKGDSTGAFYKYDEFLNMWDYVENTDTSLQLNGCTLKREGEVGLSPKDNSYYVCKHFEDDAQAYDACKWVAAQEIDFIKRDEKCEDEDVGRIIAGSETPTNKYYCTVNGWVNLMGWSFDVPKEFHFNPDIDYGTMTDKRDGKRYRTTNIGGQVWMAENLNYEGNGIGLCYDDIPENCEAGGRLYTWDEAKRVCPEGWHLPSKTEFDTLFSTVMLLRDNEKESLADMFKATSGWKTEYSLSGLDKVGFSAVPAGGWHIESYRATEYNHAGSVAYFVTSTEYNELYVYVVQLYRNELSITPDYENTFLDGWPHYATRQSAFSVRCLKDE